MLKKNHKLILALLYFTSVISQERNINNNDLFTNVKIFFINQSSGFYTNNQVFNFLNDKSNCELISSKGFDEDILFIKIKVRGNFEEIRKQKIKDSLYINNKVPFSCDYIIATNLNEKKFYRLKGFDDNDFLKLFEDSSCKKKNRAFFLNNFYVNELDLECLFDYHFKRKKGETKPICLISCIERDKKFVKINHR